MTVLDELIESLNVLAELSPKRKRKRKAGKAGKAMSRQCPPGYHGSAGNCKRVGGGQKSRERRLKKKWRRSGAGAMSKRRQKRYARTFGDSHVRVGQLISEARELLGLECVPCQSAR
jgi:hypothetical protein